MSFLKKVEDSLKEAMKAKDSFRLEVLRMVKAAVKHKELEPPIHELTEPEFIAVLTTLVKQRKEAAEQYEKGGRQDLAQKENSEIAVIQEFLPKALSDSEVDSLIAAAVAACGATGPGDMGKVMKELKDKTAGRVDGKLLSDKVRAALQNK